MRYVHDNSTAISYVYWQKGEVMNRAETMQLLSEHKSQLSSRFGVVGLALFGSKVRNSATGSSDLDILVSFDPKIRC
ncbi:MAG: nucleotidyltransferase family protein [Mariprofundaceae bacterium]